ncbi:MAG: hypothetical protein K9L70_09805 [Thiohalocapsa sp.]|nr:hypothetical protein [Thiohalocapsa sp.]MCF7992735.1 hypothetical protein [Thiohalocapsa sp.]
MSDLRAYSQRLLPPFSGMVQIVESERARAQSFDGVTWELHYLPRDRRGNGGQSSQMGYALDRGYYRVAHFENKKLAPYVFPSILDPAQVNKAIQELSDFLRDAKTPFAAADVFEYWLLDGSDESPLAMIFSCCDEAQMSTYPSKTEWTALPHSKLKVESTAEEQARGEPPVNHRFQAMVANRAGSKPRTAWFKRAAGDADDFPALLVREDWPAGAEHALCQRYLQRKAPLLLMLQGLSDSDRARLEIAAKKHAMEVEGYYPSYPAIHDEALMTAIRVEARLRRRGPQTADRSPDKKPANAPLSKDMRILE